MSDPQTKMDEKERRKRKGSKGKSPRRVRPVIPFSRKKADSEGRSATPTLSRPSGPASPRATPQQAASAECPKLRLDVMDKLAYYVELHCIEEGIFRVPGNQADIQELIQTFDKGVDSIELERYSAHTVCGALKLYLRNQQSSLLGAYAVDNIPNFDAILGADPAKVELASSEAVEQVLEAVLGIISKVPFENRPLLRRLIIMLAYVNTFEDITKMNAANLGMVFGPSLMKQGAASYTDELRNARKASQLCTFMLRHHEEIVARLPMESSGFRLFGKPVPFTSTQIALLTTNCKLHTYKKGEKILQEGADNKKLLFLQNGSAIVMKYGKNAGTLKQNDMIGAMSFLGSTIVSNTVVASSPSEVLELDLDFLGALFTATPELFMTFYWLLAERLGKRLQELPSLNMVTSNVGNSSLLDMSSSKRRRRKAAVFAGDAQQPFMEAPASSVVREMEQRSGGKMIVVKVYTSLAGSGNFKTIACPEQEGVGALLQRCLQKFMVVEGAESYELFLLPPETEDAEFSNMGALKPLNRARAVASACKSKIAMPRLLLAKGQDMSLRTGNRKHRRWRYSINQHIVIGEFANVKYKNNLGTLYISQLHIAHYSKLHRDKTKQTKLVIQYETIENVTQSDTSLTLTIKGKASLLQFANQGDADNTFRLLRTLHKNAGKQHLALQGETTKFAENIDRFIALFIQKPPVPAYTHPTVIRNFLEATANAIKDHPLWQDCTMDEVDLMQESLEKYVLKKLHFKLFASSDEEVTADKELFSWINKLRRFITPDHLHISVPPNAVEDLRVALFRAEQALTEINLKRTPKDKIDCVLACGKHLFNAIKCLGMSADDLLPLFTMALLLANPPQLRSNMEFIQRYRNAAKLKSEAGYVLVQLETAIYFLENVDHDQLNGVTEAEFELMTSDAVGADANAADAEAQAEAEAEEAAAAAELQAILELQEVDTVPSIRVSEELVIDAEDGDLLQWLSDASNREEGQQLPCSSPREDDVGVPDCAAQSRSDAVQPLAEEIASTPQSLAATCDDDEDQAAKKKAKKKKKKTEAEEKEDSGELKAKKKKKSKDKGKEKKTKDKAKEKSKEKKEGKKDKGEDGQEAITEEDPGSPTPEQPNQGLPSSDRVVQTMAMTPAPKLAVPAAVSPPPVVEALSPRRKGTPITGRLINQRRISRRPSKGLFLAQEDAKGKHRSVSIQEAQSHVIRMRDMNEFHKVFSSKKHLEVDSDDLLNPVLRATVIVQHEAQSWAEISLRLGQLVLVTTHKGGVLDIAGILRKGWWNGELGGCSGWFPRNCVEVLEEPTSNKQFVDAGYRSLMNLPTRQDWDILLEKSTVQVYNEDDIISHVGDRFQHLYLVRKGQCRMETVMTIGTGDVISQTMGLVEVHETFGELALLLGVDNNNTSQLVANKDDTEVVALEPEHLKSCFGADPALGGRFLKFLCCVLEQRIRKMEELVFSG